MKSVFLLFLMFFTQTVQAHSPDLSSVMIYEQNGRTFITIKGSLTAFEGEIDYLFKKNAYKTPEEFQELVIKHFKKNCIVIINNDIIKLENPHVILGHETTVFAELQKMPKKINSIFIKNTLFKDMPNNVCELILTLQGLPQKQYILNIENNHQVNLHLVDNNWTNAKVSNFFSSLPLGFNVLCVLLIVSIIIILMIRKRIFN